MYDLVKSINSYIELLKNEFNLNVTLHDRGGHFLHHKELIEHNVHSNSFCMYVKTNSCIWDKCIARQKKLIGPLENGPFFGMCYMGVEEYVFPVVSENNIIGFVCVSGYRKDEKKADMRLAHACEEYGFDYNTLKTLYLSSLSADIPDFEYVSTLVTPLIYMISALAADLPGHVQNNAEYIYAHILSYIKRNYGSKITVSDLCALCHCSPSYLMRIFKKMNGNTLSKYINNFRLEKAKHFLTQTDMSITDIAYVCGFSDSNYFSNTFKNALGVSPTSFRELKTDIQKTP